MHAITTARPQAPWWEDLNDATRSVLRLPLLSELPTDSYSGVDIIVVGAGVAGLSAALEASKQGNSVLVIDRHPFIGMGASGQNAGILGIGLNTPVGYSPPGADLGSLWTSTMQVIQELLEEASRPGSLLEASRTGSLCFATSRSSARDLSADCRRFNKLGMTAGMIDSREVERLTSGRLDTRDIVATLWMPEEGRLHPLSLLAFLASECRKRGVAVAGMAGVAECRLSSTSTSKRWQVLMEDGRMLGSGNLIWATGPLGNATQRLYALSFPLNLPDDFPLFWDSAPFIYYDFRPGNGRLAATGGRYGKCGQSARDSHYFQKIADECRRWLPELESIEPGHTWGVDIKVAPDMVPHLKNIDGSEAGIAIEGLGVMGLINGIILGRQAVRRITAAKMAG